MLIGEHGLTWKLVDEIRARLLRAYTEIKRSLEKQVVFIDMSPWLELLEAFRNWLQTT